MNHGRVPLPRRLALERVHEIRGGLGLRGDELLGRCVGLIPVGPSDSEVDVVHL